MKSIAIHRPNNRFGSIQGSIREAVASIKEQIKGLVTPAKFWSKSIRVGDFDKSNLRIEVDGRILVITAHDNDSRIDFSETGCTSTERSVLFRRTFGLPFNAD